MSDASLVALTVVGVLIAILIYQKLNEPAPVQTTVIERTVPVIDEQSAYMYPATYTSSPYVIPYYSYGSIHEYHRIHKPYTPRAWRTAPLAPSPISRIAMSHPIRARRS